MRRGQMIGARFVDRVPQPYAHLTARVMHRQLLALHLHREETRVAADHFGRAPGALGQQVADVLAAGDQFHAADHRLGVAKMQFKPARLLKPD